MTSRFLLAACLALAFVPAARAATQDVPTVAAATAADTVDAFSAALQAGEIARAAELLADDVLVLESGGAERSKAEYLAQHAAADAAFLKTAHVMRGERTARELGDVAWVGTESEIHASVEGQAVTVLSTETMVLARTAAGWRIVHIHWSSRKKP